MLRKSAIFTKLAVIKLQSRRTAVIAAIAITTAIIIDYLASRQMFTYDNFSAAIIFGFTIIARATGSFIILKYVSQAGSDLRTKSIFLAECSR